MVKKVLCIGINDYPYDGNDLNGCVNDANAWAKLLTQHYDFPVTDVKLLLDNEATKANIMAGLKNLLAGAHSGDVLVFTNSSHGTYVADTSGDEAKYDEAICPYDIKDNLIVDDELRELFADLPKGVHFTVISDSCFSGTVTKAVVGEIFPSMKTPDDRRLRFLSPALRGGIVLDRPWKKQKKEYGKKREMYPESTMKEILLSGCSDREYSYDALINGTYHGAMTYFALQAIAEAKYTITYQQLHNRLCFLVDAADYPQTPQLEGSKANKKRQLFT